MRTKRGEGNQRTIARTTPKGEGETETDGDE